MGSYFRTMSADQRAVLLALDEHMTSKDLAVKLADKFTRPRVLGLLQNLMYRGLVDNRAKLWYRTSAGEKILNKDG